jgi:hypothetical protein
MPVTCELFAIFSAFHSPSRDRTLSRTNFIPQEIVVSDPLRACPPCSQGRLLHRRGVRFHVCYISSTAVLINTSLISTGIEHCNGLSRGARIGIIVGICKISSFLSYRWIYPFLLLETHRRPLSLVARCLHNTSQATKRPGKPRVYPTNPRCWW